MSGNINVKGYYDTVHAPWGQLFYKLLWNHLQIQDKEILDFGSGFGITAEYLSKYNHVTAMEPNREMLQYQDGKLPYTQLVGGIELLKTLRDETFDVIICHNVMEYVENREELFKEFYRVLKKNGIISLVKHNKAGKVMQKAVFEYKVEEALSLIHHGNTISANFGVIRDYDTTELKRYINGYFSIDQVYGVRMFFALQNNEIKKEKDWIDTMFTLECEAEEIPVFRDIAYFHHIILVKTK